MNSKLKKAMPIISIIGVLFGYILNKVLIHYFGNNASNIFVAVCVTIVFCAILLSMAMRQYVAAVSLFVISVPVIIGGLGLYWDNMNLIDLSILLMFIIYPITGIVLKRYMANR